MPNTESPKPIQWATESAWSGVVLQSFNDGLGRLGAPGTWYRVVRPGSSYPITRHRGDALRMFQRLVRRTA